MTKNNTKTTLILTMTFLAVLMVSTGIDHVNAEVGSLTYEFGFRDGSTSGLSSLASDDNGYVYIAYGNTPTIEKWSIDGTFVESWPVRDDYLRSISADSNGNVYVEQSGNGGTIDVYDSSGNFIFNFLSGIGTNFHVFDKLNDVLYYSESSNVYAYNSTGTLIDVLPIGPDLFRSISIDNDGNIYQLNYYGNVTKHDSTGSLLGQWNITMDYVDYSSVYGNDDKIYVTFYENKYYPDNGSMAIIDVNTNAIEIMLLPDPGTVFAGPIIQIGNYLYVSVENAVPNVLVYSIEEEETFCNQPESYYNIIYGTNSSDYLRGTQSPDLIFGYGGNDLIKSFGSNNCIYGDSGDDVILTSGGNNTAYGGLGNDFIEMDKNSIAYGENGNDKLFFMNPEEGHLMDGGSDTEDICGSSRTTDVINVVDCEILSQ